MRISHDRGGKEFVKLMSPYRQAMMFAAGKNLLGRGLPGFGYDLVCEITELDASLDNKSPVRPTTLCLRDLRL